jgi:hypothetical protein
MSVTKKKNAEPKKGGGLPSLVVCPAVAPPPGEEAGPEKPVLASNARSQEKQGHSSAKIFLPDV